MQNDSKLSHSKYQEYGPVMSIWKMGGKVGKLLSHTSSNMAYWRILLVD
jgi:hypothetical protein